MWQKAENFLLKDKDIGPLIKKYGHCTIRKESKSKYFETLVESIVSQQVSGKAADAIYNRIQEYFATYREDELNPDMSSSFRGNTAQKEQRGCHGRLKKEIGITPQKLAKAPIAKLRKAGLSRQKTKYLKDLARKVISNKLQISSLDKLSDEEVTKELVAVKGIGVWTAKMFLMFSLARPDVFPVEDLGIRNSLKKMFKKDYSVRKIEQIAMNWKPYRTLASWYLWRFLENR